MMHMIDWLNADLVCCQRGAAVDRSTTDIPNEDVLHGGPHGLFVLFTAPPAFVLAFSSARIERKKWHSYRTDLHNDQLPVCR
jgi:hypothetical protein